MLRPVNVNQGWLNQIQPLSLPETQIITGAASITSQKRTSRPPGGSVGKLERDFNRPSLREDHTVSFARQFLQVGFDLDQNWTNSLEEPTD
jgi:hypothetical protein